MLTRPPAIAGRFYPADPSRLREEIDGYVRRAATPGAADQSESAPSGARSGGAFPKALIAPHAGTIYSGPIAGTAYARWLPGADQIRRVVLLGPAHRVWVEGLATSSAERFRTPLGDVAVDRGSVLQVERIRGVAENDEAHRQEHSLEVHLPFLQSVLGAFELVPLVVGSASAELVAEVIEALWGGDETAIVISSDLSHFHDYETACRIDRETSELIEALDGERLSGERACGYQPIRGLLHVARRRDLGVKLIDLRNSGDTAGTRREVVGYGSYVVA